MPRLVYIIQVQSRPMRARGLKFVPCMVANLSVRVAPHAGAWIEIFCRRTPPTRQMVAPHAGAWIEIADRASYTGDHGVAPHAGAWIEIRKKTELVNSFAVAPHAGAWIEIITLLLKAVESFRRAPMRARGLKCLFVGDDGGELRRALRGRVD